MQPIAVGILIGLLCSCSAAISGPYLLWGHDKVFNLQPQALVDASSKEQPLTQLFTDAKAIVIFVRNNTSRLEGTKYPKFENLVKNNVWAYLPQRSLAAEPYSFNANIEVCIQKRREGESMCERERQLQPLLGFLLYRSLISPGTARRMTLSC